MVSGDSLDYQFAQDFLSVRFLFGYSLQDSLKQQTAPHDIYCPFKIDLLSKQRVTVVLPQEREPLQQTSGSYAK
jgi:hypothetical protein